MCGLFGYVGENPNLEKIKILGLFNVSRGKDSSGLYINNEIIKSAQFNQKEFQDFIKKNTLTLDKTKDNRVIFGHTRNSSSGMISDENAHPFGYLDKNKTLKHAFAHNGTLRGNWKQLIYDEKLMELEEVNSYTVDSKALGSLISQGKYEILSKYQGAATFLYHDVNKPDTLYVWKGTSIQTNKKKEVDRPLFYLKSDNGYYVSSLKDSLEVIKNSKDETVESFEEDKLLAITSKGIKTFKEVERNVELPTVFYTSSGAWSKDWTNNNYNGTTKKNKNYSKVRELNYTKKTSSNVLETCNLECDTLSENINSFNGKPYIYKGRYHRNGHLLVTDKTNGIEFGKITYYFYNGIPVINNNFLEPMKVLFDGLKNASEAETLMKLRTLSIWSSIPVFFWQSETAHHVKCNKSYFNNKLISTKNYQFKGARKFDVCYENGVLKSFAQGNQSSTVKQLPEGKTTNPLIDMLKTKPDEFWVNYDFDVLDFDNLTEDLFNFYTDKMHKFDIVNFNPLTGKPWKGDEYFKAEDAFTNVTILGKQLTSVSNKSIDSEGDIISTNCFYIDHKKVNYDSIQNITKTQYHNEIQKLDLKNDDEDDDTNESRFSEFDERLIDILIDVDDLIGKLSEFEEDELVEDFYEKATDFINIASQKKNVFNYLMDKKIQNTWDNG